MIGYVFIVGYIILVGIAIFLEKVSVEKMTSYQFHTLLSIGMVIASIALMWWDQKNLNLPIKHIPWGVMVGIIYGVGSLCFVLALTKHSVGVVSTLSNSYLLVALLLSVLFLNEEMNTVKGVGIALALVGLAMVSYTK